jgi:hypothetical protein
MRLRQVMKAFIVSNINLIFVIFRLTQQTRNVLQLVIGFFFVFLAFNSQGFIEESVLDSFAIRGLVHRHDGYTRFIIFFIGFDFFFV